MDEFESYVRYWESRKIEEHERQLNDLLRRETAISQGDTEQERLDIIGKQINYHSEIINKSRFNN
ncbi:hypothetical protein [Enterobacter hormaechei]|uniref:hypothetical protein n=1 Tax=Enterobacter hormaechei TaxID=158836 RepID=UPI00197F2B14|nr:hypothetical protein [Enterobacter hormaechei]MBN4832258.1 hypothetical protein [Enterobacter hormaechei]